MSGFKRSARGVYTWELRGAPAIVFHMLLLFELDQDIPPDRERASWMLLSGFVHLG
jgi:hypothetical protein